MIELMKYFRILFLSKNLSRERLKDFTEDHIQRLTANNPGGIFTGILTALTTAYNSYFGDLSSESINVAVQKGKTEAMNESRAILLRSLSENEKLVAYTYRSNQPVYLEFYPQGLSEYYDADIPTLETISNRYKNILADHAADFTPTFVSDYNTIQTTYVTNRAAQQAAMGSVAGERSDLVTSKADLARQLTTNLLTIALQYVGNESKCEVYFNQAILNAAFAESETKITADINPGATDNVFENITKATVGLMIKNTGTVPLTFGFAAAADTPVTPTPDNTIPAGEERGGSAGERGWTPTNKYLNVTNSDGLIGSYVVEKV